MYPRFNIECFALIVKQCVKCRQACYVVRAAFIRADRVSPMKKWSLILANSVHLCFEPSLIDKTYQSNVHTISTHYYGIIC